MQKKSFILLVLLLILPFVFAQQAEVQKATQCLENKIIERTCSDLTTEEKVFSLLAARKCETELFSDSKNSGECWPSSNCNIKQTAQSILALDSVGTATDKSQTWLSSQAKTAEDILWYLQVDTNDAASCTISYSNNSYPITIDANKKINTHAGDCLRLAQEDSWLRVPSVSCYGQEFKISCDKSFKTNLIFKQTNSQTIFISEKINSGSAGSSVTEKIKSSCLSTEDSCDYEGTLWTALALKKADKDVSQYLPYLITSANTNRKYIPESFLYLLAGSSYYEDLLSKQKNSQYWDESGDKLYDTALALYPLQPETSTEKTAAINWILNNQKADGCWDNLRNTAFILYSLWPLKPLSGEDCQTSGGYCLPDADCEGNILSGSCTSGLKCCSKPAVSQNCAVLNGKICSLNEQCQGKTIQAGDTNICCLSSCTAPLPSEKSMCEENKGSCKSLCGSDETESSLTCGFSGDICCLKKESSSYWYIWLLAILILLVALAIIFRNKLKDFWSGLNSRFKKSLPPSNFPSYPSEIPRIPRGIIRRRILPQQSRPVSGKPPSRPKRREELDEVLKKLKEIGK